MYDVGGKLLNGIKSMYINSLAWARVKGGESECFRFKEKEVWMSGKLGKWCMVGVYNRGLRMNAWDVNRGMNPWP